ncbi:MAG: hypothetical protein R3B13_13290 [Polyangiaceae bacterium]
MTVSRFPAEACSTPDVEPVVEETPLRRYDCDGCGKSFEGHPGGAGLFVWTRGDEVRYEEPPLCDECGERIALGAILKWISDEEEEG